jgi:hypothetical protein
MSDIVGISKELINGADLWETIQKVGLHDDPAMSEHYGLENQRMLETNGMLQEPHQLRDALLFLGTKKIESYFEVGTFFGDATLIIFSYLKNKNPTLTGISIDVTDRGEAILEYAKSIDLEIKIATSDSYKEHTSDLCFIDGDHTYDWVKRDWENVGQYSKYCMFHDIQDEWLVERDGDGPVKFWNEIKNPDYMEFLYHPEGKKYFGLGIKINE